MSLEISEKRHMECDWCIDLFGRKVWHLEKHFMRGKVRMGESLVEIEWCAEQWVQYFKHKVSMIEKRIWRHGIHIQKNKKI